MNIGIVGTGNIGSTLIDGLLAAESRDIRLFAYDQMQAKITTLGAKYPELTICDGIETVAQNSEVIVFAVPFTSIQRLSGADRTAIESHESLVLALCGYAPLNLLEKYLPAKVAKAFPNINWAVGSGVTMVMVGERFTELDKQMICMSSKGFGQTRYKNKRGFQVSDTIFLLFKQPLKSNYTSSVEASFSS